MDIVLLTHLRRAYQNPNRDPPAIQSYDWPFHLRPDQYGRSIRTLHAIDTGHSEFDGPSELAVSQYNQLRCSQSHE